MDDDGYHTLVDIDWGPAQRRFMFAVECKGWFLAWAGLLKWHDRVSVFHGKLGRKPK